LVRYGTSIILVVLASAATLLIWPFIKPLASLLFTAAVVISALRGGKGPGFTATILSVLSLDYVFITPRYQLLGGAWDDIGPLLAFTIQGSLLALLIDSRKQVENQVRESHEQLRSLSAHQQSMLEEERTRIAREIHDELGQALTGLKFDIFWLRDEVTKSSGGTSSCPLLDKLNGTLLAIDTTIHSVKRIARELRPAVLDTLGLAAAIEWQAEDFQKRTGIRCQFDSGLTEVQVDPEVATTLFRIFQEALTNIARHADAREIEIKLERVQGHLLLQLKDNGRGIDYDTISTSTSLGILGMRERVRLLRGQISVKGQLGKGTVVSVEIPV
jgi:two-component system, NarL family, sensor histidine kinase UhpB